MRRLWVTKEGGAPVLTCSYDPDSSSVKRAANQIYNAVAQGRAEILTPQAWLAARTAAVAPETMHRLASLANEFLLPAPHHRERSPAVAEKPGNNGRPGQRLRPGCRQQISL